MDEMLSDGEHREYYEDRSLKAVYAVKNGKKNGMFLHLIRWFRSNLN